MCGSTACTLHAQKDLERASSFQREVLKAIERGAGGKDIEWLSNAFRGCRLRSLKFQTENALTLA